MKGNITSLEEYTRKLSEKEYANDLKFIKSEIIARQKNGTYCKYSSILRSLVVTDMTLSSHIMYWERLYKGKPKYMIDGIVEVCEDKILNGCISLEEMNELVKKSNDSEKEKIRILGIINHR